MSSAEEFLQEIRTEYLETATESLDKCEALLLANSENHDDDAVDTIMRLLHSMKGEAQAVEWPDFATAIHKVETWILENRQLSIDDFQSQLLRDIDNLRDGLSKAF